MKEIKGHRQRKEKYTNNNADHHQSVGIKKLQKTRKQVLLISG